MTGTWEQAAQEAMLAVPNGLTLLFDFTDPLDEIDHYLDKLRSNDERPSYQSDYFSYIADDALGGYIGCTDSTRADAKELVLRTIISKQHDYGHDNILWGGLDGLIVRMHDKSARIRNLVARARHVSNESLADSWLDVVGYALIGIMLIEGTFTRQLAADIPSLAPTWPDYQWNTTTEEAPPETYEAFGGEPFAGPDHDDADEPWSWREYGVQVPIAGLEEAIADESARLIAALNRDFFITPDLEWNEKDSPDVMTFITDNDCMLHVAAYPQWTGDGPRVWIATETDREHREGIEPTGPYLTVNGLQEIVSYLQGVLVALRAQETIDLMINDGVLLCGTEEAA